MEALILKTSDNSEDFLEVIKLLSQLKTVYDIESLSEKVENQLNNGYQIVYVKSGNDIQAAASFRLILGRPMLMQHLSLKVCKSSPILK